MLLKFLKISSCQKDLTLNSGVTYGLSPNSMKFLEVELKKFEGTNIFT